MAKTKAQKKLKKEFMKTWKKLIKLYDKMVKIDPEEAEHMSEIVELE